jgi:hypothetical protein
VDQLQSENQHQRQRAEQRIADLEGEVQTLRHRLDDLARRLNGTP